MRLYSVGAFIKIFVGIIILSVLYNYVNAFDHTSLGLGFGFLGVFMIIWGLGYFFFLSLRSVCSSCSEHIKRSASYKLSLMLGVYTIVNLTFMIIDQRSTLLGVVLIVLFVIMQYLIIVDFRKQEQ